MFRKKVEIEAYDANTANDPNNMDPSTTYSGASHFLEPTHDEAAQSGGGHFMFQNSSDYDYEFQNNSENNSISNEKHEDLPPPTLSNNRTKYQQQFHSENNSDLKCTLCDFVAQTKNGLAKHKEIGYHFKKNKNKNAEIKATYDDNDDTTSTSNDLNNMEPNSYNSGGGQEEETYEEGNDSWGGGHFMEPTTHSEFQVKLEEKEDTDPSILSSSENDPSTQIVSPNFTENDQPDAVTQSEFKCTQCNKSFYHRRNLTRHIQNVHEGKGFTEIIPTSEGGGQIENSECKCTFCGFVAINKRGLAKHLTKHSSTPQKYNKTRLRICQTCGRDFTPNATRPGYANAKRDFANHIKRCGVKHQCLQCKKIFERPSRLMEHLRNAKKCARLRAQEGNVMNYLPNVPLPVPQLDVSFDESNGDMEFDQNNELDSSNDYIDEEIFYNDDDENYVVNEEKSSSDPTGPGEHFMSGFLEIEMEEKAENNLGENFNGDSVKCSLCGFVAINKRGLAKHLATHPETQDIARNSNFCKFCGKTFPWNNGRNNLKRHIKFVHEGVKLQCDFCEKSCNSSSALKYHMKKEHPNETLLDRRRSKSKSESIITNNSEPIFNDIEETEYDDNYVNDDGNGENSDQLLKMDKQQTKQQLLNKCDTSLKRDFVDQIIEQEDTDTGNGTTDNKVFIKEEFDENNEEFTVKEIADMIRNLSKSIDLVRRKEFDEDARSKIIGNLESVRIYYKTKLDMMKFS